MSLNAQFLLALLRLPNGVWMPEKAVSETYLVLSNGIHDELGQAHREGLVMYLEGSFIIPEKNRLQLVLKCLEEGVSVETVCKAAGWREFEDLVQIVLEANNYRTKKHFRFRHQGRGNEIDILALRQPWSLSVECKRWKKSWQPSTLRKIADVQIEKTRGLASIFPSLSSKLPSHVGKDLKLIPVVLILSRIPTVIHSGVPFVSICQLQSFLEQFEGYAEDLVEIKVL
jgi:Holliday junction resolvase-like predicted endonuclease